ncbi:tetraacyldisaccharide 4'-kinase [Sphingobacterium multivorum]|uniref:tetraacyldisaccharide 4'-kinase n=1 Tax=Sphingobacterium multivorum TaxID=28454 RepID=UPI00289670EA|nr:tetraacyldisaccharide 4'-kinase [Sphingobacterium multivorum]
MIAFLRYLLFPFSILYGLIVWLRNRLYDFKLLSSKSFEIPTIVIGNLSVGGTGKSPMTEFVVSSLKDQYKTAILSRGYGRVTSGFYLVKTDSLANNVGDEPLQFKNKFPSVTVAVCEDRCTGIEKLQSDHQLIILDDAYQHRKLSPLFNILLFDFLSFGSPMFVFPTGNFRDLMIEAKRAQIITITKCPIDLSNPDKKRIERKIRRYNKNALITFSHINYFQAIDSVGNTIDFNDSDVILVTGIAKPQPLVDYIKKKANLVKHLSFGDHHTFSESDIEQITKSYRSLASSNKMLLTTEKDFQRLKPFQQQLAAIDLVYLPIGLQFHDPIHKELFLKTIHNAVAQSVNQP